MPADAYRTFLSDILRRLATNNPEKALYLAAEHEAEIGGDSLESIYSNLGRRTDFAAIAHSPEFANGGEHGSGTSTEFEVPAERMRQPERGRRATKSTNRPNVEAVRVRGPRSLSTPSQRAWCPVSHAASYFDDGCVRCLLCEALSRLARREPARRPFHEQYGCQRGGPRLPGSRAWGIRPAALRAAEWFPSAREMTRGTARRIKRATER